ncbi:chlorohydrolase [Streptococcus pneumoniae]|nr:chlorohydrolase [Streptococcus pneumoniae]
MGKLLTRGFHILFVKRSLYSMKIKEQTRKLAAGCSKQCFEVVDRTEEVSSRHCFEVVDRTDRVSSKHVFEVVDETDRVSSKHCFEVVDKTDRVSNLYTAR